MKHRSVKFIAFWLHFTKHPHLFEELSFYSMHFLKRHLLSPHQLDKCVITEIALGNEAMRNRSLVKEWCRADTALVIPASSTLQTQSDTLMALTTFFFFLFSLLATVAAKRIVASVIICLGLRGSSVSFYRLLSKGKGVMFLLVSVKIFHEPQDKLE